MLIAGNQPWFLRGVAWGKNLIVADKTWLIGMFRTTAKQEPTAESWAAATQFDTSHS